MKSVLALMLLTLSPMVLADQIEVPCDFREGRGPRQNFVLRGEGTRASFNVQGSVLDVSVALSYSISAGRSLLVSYYHDGVTHNLNNSRSGTGTIEYSRGLISRAFGAPRDVNVRCHPQNLVVTAASQPQPQPQRREVQPQPTPRPTSQPAATLDRSSIVLPTVSADLPAGISGVVTLSPALAGRVDPNTSGVTYVQNGRIVGQPVYERGSRFCMIGAYSAQRFTSVEGPFAITAIKNTYTLEITMVRRIGGRNQQLVITCPALETLEQAQAILGDQLDLLVEEESAPSPEVEELVESEITHEDSDRSIQELDLEELANPITTSGVSNQ